MNISKEWVRMHRTKDVIKSELLHYKMVQYYILNWKIERVEKKIAELEQELYMIISYERDIMKEVPEPW